MSIIRRALAFGDPQAPHDTLLALLDRRGLLVAGRIRHDVRLVAMGDHFDWGAVEARAEATADGLRTLSWLASHDPAQVVILLGNHDLARVGELAYLDDVQFSEARREADQAYRHGAPPRDEESFRRAFALPSWEVAARDFSAFSVAQRDLVWDLLRAGRLRLAYAPREDLLLSHAGVTVDELAALGLAASERDARVVDMVLARVLAEAVSRAHAMGSPVLVIPGLHHPGDGSGEGTGMCFHRLARGPSPRPPRRRFSPRRLPTGFSQAIGHVRDKKARLLLDLPLSGRPEGGLRTLTVGEGHLRYDWGVLPCPAGHARCIYLDGGMGHAELARIELLDLEHLRPALSGPSSRRPRPGMLIAREATQARRARASRRGGSGKRTPPA